MKKLYIILILMVGALVSSCTKESPNHERESHRGISLKITPPATAVTTTRAVGAPEEGTEAENKIENLKVYILKEFDGDLVIAKVYDFDPSANRYFTNSERWVAATWSLEVNEPTDPDVAFCAIFVAANWHPTNSKDFEVGNSFLNFESAYTVCVDEIESPFVMSSFTEIEPTEFISGARFKMGLVRQPIKVEMTVKLDDAFAAAYPDFSFGELGGQKPTMGVVATPNMSRVFPMALIDGTPGFKYVAIPSKDMTTAADGKSWTASFYLNENDNKQQSQSPFRRTILSVQLPHQKTGSADVVTENYYTIAIKTDKSVQPYSLYRNTIYRVTATLLGFGSTTPPDLSNNVSVAVDAAPWTDSGYDDVIGGAKLGVNLSTINIRGGVTNTQLVVSSDDLSKVEFTEYAPLLTKPTIDPITGVVSVNTVTPIGLYTPNYATFKVKRGGLSKTIKVDAGLWATGNVTYDAVNKQYVNSTNPLQNGLYFFYDGNVMKNVGLKYETANGSKWSTSSNYYILENEAIAEKSGVASYNDNRLKVAGDPCALVAPALSWRLPNKAEIDDLNAHRGSRDATTAMGQYSYGETLFFRWAGCAVSGTMQFYNGSGLYWGQDGRFELLSPVRNPGSDLIGWSSGRLDIDNFSVRCVHN